MAPFLQPGELSYPPVMRPLLMVDGVDLITSAKESENGDIVWQSLEWGHEFAAPNLLHRTPHAAPAILPLDRASKSAN